MDKKSFIIYEQWATLICGLPTDKAGELIQAICSYKIYGGYDIEDDTVKAIFNMIKMQLDADASKYQEVCRKRAENGKKGGEAKASNSRKENADDSKCYQMLPNATKSKQNVADNDNKYDNDNDIKKKRARTQSDKLVFGEYKHVRLTIEQYDRLAADYGEQTRDACIKRLDEYIQERPDYKSKDHNLCIRRWVVDAVTKNSKPTMMPKQTTFHNFDMKHDYDFDAIEQELLRR